MTGEYCTTVLPSRQNESNFFDMLSLLAKWNIISCFYEAFSKNAPKNKIPLSPDCIAVWSEEECDDSSSFFPTNQHQTLFCFFGRALYRLGKWEVHSDKFP